MNRPSLLILTLALLVGCAGVVWWLSDDSVGLPAPRSRDEAVADARAVVAESSLLEVASANGYEVGDAGADPEGPFEREEVLIEVDDAPVLRIQVWSQKRGKVAAGAEVFVLEGYRAPGRSDRFAPHRCQVAIDEGKRYRASSAGILEVPRPNGDAVVAARLPGWVGMVNVRRYRSKVDLVLQEDETVTVRVVDGRGQIVVGAPVAIQQRIPSITRRDQLERAWGDLTRRIEVKSKNADPSQPKDLVKRQLANLQRERRELVDQWRRLGQNSRSKNRPVSPSAKPKPGSKQATTKASASVTTRQEIRARRRTDERGLAVFRHFQFYRQQPKTWWPVADRNRFEAVIMVPLTKAVAAPFEGRPVPSDILELTLPATGSVALRAVDADGRPFTHPVHGELRMIDRANPQWMRLPIRKQQNEREIVFPFVGLGLQMMSVCRLDDRDFRWNTPPFDGPQEAGERVTVDFVVAPGDPMLHGRLFDQAGVPVINAKATFLINSMRGRLEGEEVLLDDEGRFHLPFQPRDDHRAPFRLQIREQGRMPVPGLARTLGVLPKSGVLDLGDLQLGVMPPITFGRVVNDLGEPISGARVQLQRHREVGRKRPGMRWEDEAFTEVRSDAEGSFALYGDLESASYRLRVSASEHFPFDEPGLPGREEAVIKLLRRSRVVGTVQLPKWLSSRRVKVDLRSHLDPKRNRTDSIRDFMGKKFIYFDWARPGVYSLTFRIEGYPDPFARVEGFEIKAAQQGEHPRLKNIDLGAELFRFEVFAVDEAGKPMTPKSPLLARVLRPSGAFELVGVGWRRGRAEVISPQPSLEVLPQAQGYRASRATLVPGRNEIRFTPVPPLSLRLPGMRQLVGDCRVVISLRPARGAKVAEFDASSRRIAMAVRRRSVSNRALGRGDLVRMTPVRNGRYRVIARLGDEDQGGVVSLTLGELDVDLGVGAAPRTMTVPVDSQAVQVAMQEVARRVAAAQLQPAGK